MSLYAALPGYTALHLPGIHYCSHNFIASAIYFHGYYQIRDLNSNCIQWGVLKPTLLSERGHLRFARECKEVTWGTRLETVICELFQKRLLNTNWLDIELQSRSGIYWSGEMMWSTHDSTMVQHELLCSNNTEWQRKKQKSQLTMYVYSKAFVDSKYRTCEEWMIFKSAASA